MFLRSQLSSIDFYKSVPKELAEGTNSGACISIAALGFAVYLILGNVLAYMEPIVHT
jgi:hypothetical protein